MWFNRQLFEFFYNRPEMDELVRLLGEKQMSFPVDPNEMRRLEATARDLFEVLDKVTNGALKERRIGMSLFLFKFGERGEMTYISNADRADMVKMLLEFIAKQPPEMTWDEQHG